MSQSKSGLLDRITENERVQEIGRFELKRQIAMQGLADALSGLVKCNEEWNAAVEGVIGKPASWNDSYLNNARTALLAAKPFLGEK